MFRWGVFFSSLLLPKLIKIIVKVDKVEVKVRRVLCWSDAR